MNLIPRKYHPTYVRFTDDWTARTIGGPETLKTILSYREMYWSERYNSERHNLSLWSVWSNIVIELYEDATRAVSKPPDVTL